MSVLFQEIVMFKGLSNVLVVLVMLFAFVGQALASHTFISCKDPAEPTLQIKNNEEIKHNDLHKSNMETSADCCGVDCCDIDCVCLAHSCSSVMYLHLDVSSTHVIVFNESIYLQKSDQPKSISTLLYRPPIFIS